ncbi:MAG: zinc ribbon domain-containing protein [Oscillospiraceae bacterium]|nr:zinc ribbon domain-containing protein [Oscillospiraceae bacterium]
MEYTDKKWKCRKCGEELKITPSIFDYMQRSFSEELLRCPKCGQVLITASLADGKMLEVEEMLEDK